MSILKINWKPKELTQAQLDAREARRRSKEVFVKGDKVKITRDALKYVPTAYVSGIKSLFDNGTLVDGEYFIRELWSVQLGLGTSARSQNYVWVHKRLCEKIGDDKKQGAVKQAVNTGVRGRVKQKP